MASNNHHPRQSSQSLPVLEHPRQGHLDYVVKLLPFALLLMASVGVGLSSFLPNFHLSVYLFATFLTLSFYLTLLFWVSRYYRILIHGAEIYVCFGKQILEQFNVKEVRVWAEASPLWGAQYFSTIPFSSIRLILHSGEEVTLWLVDHPEEFLSRFER